MVTACVNCFPALVIVNDDLPLNVKACVPDMVIPAIRVTEPYMSLVVEEKAHVGEPVAPAHVILLPSLGMSAVIVCEASKAEDITTSS